MCCIGSRANRHVVAADNDFRFHRGPWHRSVLARTRGSARKIDCRRLNHLGDGLGFVWTFVVNVVAVGTGLALDVGRRGEADVVIAHAKIAELQFLAEGNGVKRFPVMYSDFVLIGPKSDPAGIKNMKDVAKALGTIRDKQAPFISRGDGSGTHLAELALWNKDAGIEIQKDKGVWYKSISQGMGAALNMASETSSYVLSDRGTWISFRNKGDLQILVEGDRRMFNQYAVILVNPDKHPNVKKEFGQVFINWLVSPDGQKAIGNYKINGEQLFYPNAEDPNA